MANYTKLFWESYKSSFLLKEVGEYSVSSSPKTILFDFYLLSYLSTLNLDIGSKNWKGSFIGKDTDELKSLIEDAENKLLPKLKSEMLDAVFFAICAESRHIMWAATNKKSMIESDPLLKDLRDTLLMLPSSKGDSISSYQSSNDTINTILRKHGAKPYDFVKSIRKSFHSSIWIEDYGGDAWADICDGWLRLYNATNKKDMYVAIDHLYDLQHNNGSVFTKVQKYHIKGSTHWLKDALDFKAKITNIHELMPRISSDMRKIAQSALKAGGVNPDNTRTSSETEQQYLESESTKIINDLRKTFAIHDLIIEDSYGTGYVKVYINHNLYKNTKENFGVVFLTTLPLENKEVVYKTSIIIKSANLHESQSFQELDDALTHFRKNLTEVLFQWRLLQHLAAVDPSGVLL